MMTDVTPHEGVDLLHSVWAEAMRRGDVDRILSLLEPDYVLWMPGAEPIRREALRPLMEATLANVQLEPEFQCEWRAVDGDLAVERGWDVQTVTPRGGGGRGGPSQTQRQRVTLVMRRGADGFWRFAWGMSQPGPVAS